ncbi:MAG: saccharopine dehydrogenase family protein [Nocardioidaceae bacterium]
MTPASSSRIVLFGATGFTGQIVARALFARGVRPVLAGRNRGALEALAAELDTEFALADSGDPMSVAALVESGDVLVSTVGPFVKHGAAAVQAAAATGAHYLDSTGEGPFIREVFEEYGPVAARSGAGLLTAFGYDYVPGNLACALALREAGEQAVRVDCGYFLTGAGGGRDLPTRFGLPSAGTVSTLLGMMTAPGYGYRATRLVTERPARTVKTFQVDGRRLSGVSIGAVEQFALPRSFPRLREVNVYLGWFDPFSRFLQASSFALNGPRRRRTATAAVERVAPRLLTGRPAGPCQHTRDSMRALIIATAFDAEGRELHQVVLRGPEPYVLTGDLLAWGAVRAAAGNLRGAGALGPVQAFGLDELTTACAAAGLKEAGR